MIIATLQAASRALKLDVCTHDGIARCDKTVFRCVQFSFRALIIIAVSMYLRAGKQKSGYFNQFIVQPRFPNEERFNFALSKIRLGRAISKFSRCLSDPSG